MLRAQERIDDLELRSRGITSESLIKKVRRIANRERLEPLDTVAANGKLLFLDIADAFFARIRFRRLACRNVVLSILIREPLGASRERLEISVTDLNLSSLLPSVLPDRNEAVSTQQ